MGPKEVFKSSIFMPAGVVPSLAELYPNASILAGAFSRRSTASFFDNSSLFCLQLFQP
jgi:hypothetical protein